MTESLPVSAFKRNIRIFAQLMVAAVLLFLVNRFLVFWHDWPTLTATFSALMGGESELDSTQLMLGGALTLIYVLTLLFVFRYVNKTPEMTLMDDSDRFTRWAFYIVRVAFWSVFLIGLADAIISGLRVENMLVGLVGEEWGQRLDQGRDRGEWVHYPLIALSFVIAWFSRSLGFIWLAFLVVLAEFGIVLSRFIFSYEQAYMGDLVRFWYAALFLFASAYTLVEGGHVRVDVLYASLSRRAKAWVDAVGSLILGLPLCWVILWSGMEGRQSSLISPIINFEISQSGYGMYVKYLMAGFLLVFAISMAIQFISYFLRSAAILMNEVPEEITEDNTDDATVGSAA